MKLPITDKFLWQLYNFIEKMDDAHNLISSPRTMYQVVYSDIARLKRKYEKEKARRSFKQFINYLGDKGYIKITGAEAIKGLIITPKGTEKALRVKRRLIKKKKRKDGLWIMIIFDIPEKKKGARDLLRFALTALGYQQLQKSVWICPYDTYKETEEAVRLYNIEPHVKLFLIKEIR